MARRFPPHSKMPPNIRGTSHKSLRRCMAKVNIAPLALDIYPAGSGGHRPPLPELNTQTSYRAVVRVDSPHTRVNVDIVITALSRCIVLIVAASIFAVTLPTRAEVPKPPRHRTSCCAHMPGESGHCGRTEPVKSQDRQCCAPCNLCFSLIAVSNYLFVFSPDRGEKLVGEIATSSSRSDRPPVPPPRV